jgi:hypothetical protein
MTGGTGTLRATLYSTALRVVAREEFRGPWLSGWNSLSWALPWLKNGMYFAQFSLAAGNPAKPVPLYIIR